MRASISTSVITFSSFQLIVAGYNSVRFLKHMLQVNFDLLHFRATFLFTSHYFSYKMAQQRKNKSLFKTMI